MISLGTKIFFFFFFWGGVLSSLKWTFRGVISMHLRSRYRMGIGFWVARTSFIIIIIFGGGGMPDITDIFCRGGGKE